MDGWRTECGVGHRLDAAPARHARSRRHRNALRGRGQSVVVGWRRRQPCLLRERVRSLVVRAGQARDTHHSSRGGEPPRWRDWRMSAERISIAIPTGVLTKGALQLLDRSGLASLSAEELGRQLLVERLGLRVILVRPADVPAYVDHGAADLGIVGKDILWESPGAHYELGDLHFGDCRLVLAVPDSSKLNGPETWPPMLRIATKYPRTTSAWFEARGQAVEVVTLH